MNSICTMCRKTVVCKLCGNIRQVKASAQPCSSKATATDMIFKEQIEGERQGCCENPSFLPFARG